MRISLTACTASSRQYRKQYVQLTRASFALEPFGNRLKSQRKVMNMLNTNDILETIKMIQEENLDIRTITMGISLL